MIMSFFDSIKKTHLKKTHILKSQDKKPEKIVLSPEKPESLSESFEHKAKEPVFEYWTAWICLTVEERVREFTWPFTEAFSNQWTPFTTVWRVEPDGIKMTSDWVGSRTGCVRKIKKTSIHKDSRFMMDFLNGNIQFVTYSWNSSEQCLREVVVKGFFFMFWTFLLSAPLF